MNIPDKTMEQRIHEAIGRALGVNITEGSAPLQRGATPGWDSMGHMMVVIEIEEEFQTSFPPYLVSELMDVPSITNALQNGQAK